MLNTAFCCFSGNRDISTLPTRDCNAATRKLPRASLEALSVSSISCTPALQRLHLPSNKTIGRESAGLKMAGIGYSDELSCVDRLSAKPKRALKVGGGVAIGATAAIVVAERDDDDVDDVITCDFGASICDVGEKAPTEAMVTITTKMQMRADEANDILAMVGWLVVYYSYWAQGTCFLRCQ